MPTDYNKKIEDLKKNLDYKKSELKKTDNLYIRNREKIRAKKFQIRKIEPELKRLKRQLEIHEKDLKDLEVYRIKSERNIFKTKTEIKNTESEIRKTQLEMNRKLIHKQ